VPNVQEIEWLRLIDVKWILVIEKDASHYKSLTTLLQVQIR